MGIDYTFRWFSHSPDFILHSIPGPILISMINQFNGRNKLWEFLIISPNEVFVQGPSNNGEQLNGEKKSRRKKIMKEEKCTLWWLCMCDARKRNPKSDWLLSIYLFDHLLVAMTDAASSTQHQQQI